jgi:hypothetical protein
MARARVHRREITEAERQRILEEVGPVLDSVGLTNHNRSRFASLVGEGVVGSKHPLFSSMQPQIKVRDGAGWRRAYAMVLSYLGSAAPETARTIEMELSRSRRRAPGAASEEPFETLLRISPAPFAERAAAFDGTGPPIALRRSGRRSLSGESEVIDFNAGSASPLPSEDGNPAIDELSSGQASAGGSLALARHNADDFDLDEFDDEF